MVDFQVCYASTPFSISDGFTECGGKSHADFGLASLYPP